MGFDPYNLFMKIQKSNVDSNSQNASSLGSVKVHSHTFSHTPGLPSWLAPLRAFALVASPKLGLRQIHFSKFEFNSIEF
jgi:hypothetical protein